MLQPGRAGGGRRQRLHVQERRRARQIGRELVHRLPRQPRADRARREDAPRARQVPGLALGG